MRPAHSDDCLLLWEWANDPTTRAVSFSPDPIPWERHCEWFADRMRDSRCLILIAEEEPGTPVGQLRVDWRSREDGEIDVSLVRSFRGRGYGNRLIDRGTRQVFATTPTERLHAFIRPENRASIRAFEQSSFVRLGEEIVKGHPALHYVRYREVKESR